MEFFTAYPFCSHRPLRSCCGRGSRNWSSSLSHDNSIFDTEYDRAKVPPYNGNDPPPAPSSLKAFLFPPLSNKVQNKGMRWGTSKVRRGLPPFVSIVRYPGRPAILRMEISLCQEEFFSLSGVSPCIASLIAQGQIHNSTPAIGPTTAGTFRKKFRKSSGKKRSQSVSCNSPREYGWDPQTL